MAYLVASPPVLTRRAYPQRAPHPDKDGISLSFPAHPHQEGIPISYLALAKSKSPTIALVLLPPGLHLFLLPPGLHLLLLPPGLLLSLLLLLLLGPLMLLLGWRFPSLRLGILLLLLGWRLLPPLPPARDCCCSQERPVVMTYKQRAWALRSHPYHEGSGNNGPILTRRDSKYGRILTRRA